MVEHTLLHYSPRCDRGERYASRRWLAWPTWAFRVIVPQPFPGGLNCLQRVVLGVLRASALTHDELGQRLGLAPALIAHIERELLGMGYLEEGRRLTARGRSALAESEEADADLAPAWVFADPWSDGLWPFVTPRLAKVALEPRPGQPWPTVCSDPTDGKHLRPWWVPHPQSAPPAPPATSKILRAALEHARMEHWWRNGRAGEDTAPPSLYATRTIDRLVAIEPVPIRAHLLTYVYVSEGSGTELDWAVCDPFGRGASITLRRWLLERGQDDEHLEQYVDELLEREGSKSLAELRATERSLELGARQVLVRQLGLGLEDHPRIHEHLRNALVELEAARALGGSARTRRCSNGLLSCRKSLEALFSTLAERWPLDAVELPIDPDLRQNAIEQAGVACRLDPIPAPLLHIQPKQLRSVTRYEDNWRARPLLLATLLCARHDTSHPLRHAAQRDARLLERIDGVLETSSKSVHDGRSSPSLAMLERCTNTTISVVGLLLDLNDSWARPADG